MSDLAAMRRILAELSRAESAAAAAQVARAVEHLEAALQDPAHDEGNLPQGIDRHIRARAEAILERVKALQRPGSKDSHAPSVPQVDSATLSPRFAWRNPELEEGIRKLGAPIWATRNRRDFVSYPKEDPAWWSCPINEGHPPWSMTLWQFERGRVCPKCLHEAGFSADAWAPEAVPLAASQLPGAPGWRPTGNLGQSHFSYLG